MTEIIALIAGIACLMLGSVLGYFARQSIAKRQAHTLEAQLAKRINQAKAKSQSIISEAKEKGIAILEKTKQEASEERRDLLKTERFLRKKETNLEEKNQLLFRKEEEFRQRVQQLKSAKEAIRNLREEAASKLEKVSGFSQEQAKKELFDEIEKTHQKEVFEKIKKLEQAGWEKFENRAKEILAFAIQKCAVSQAQDITSTTVALPNEEIKGRIIGKDGRNIKALEKLTGTEVVIDETPEMVVISAFNPLRRHIAKIALERLIKDGRIQPARIEKEVEKAKEEIISQIKKAGEQAVFETGILGLDPKIIELLGRLNFRTSYGQNVLLHSIEVSYLASALASELGADEEICKKAGLLHDIGKSVDHQIEGSHVDIGIKILEKFGVEKEIVVAIKSHHDEYESESLEAILVQVADQISGSRPGARKETLENYLKRLENLENIALGFTGVKEVYAIQAGRELRVFVKPDEIDDAGAHKMARDIASQIERDLKYPGEIKVTLIREQRIIEYAK